jgi:hypothetical protein
MTSAVYSTVNTVNGVIPLTVRVVYGP